MNNIGEQHRHLLVLSRSADLCDRCAALVTELGAWWQFGAARSTRQSRRCQRTATTVIHVSIVSPLVNDVRHIAVRSDTKFCQCHADGVGWLAPRLILPSWLVSLVRLVDARGPADLA